ncbi:uncharacterized protein NDAI_0D01780 [Naumovozyma dairenensis CBS 421]|uniref:Uncharacterized protein n=1 Tax=Naumovozyma dairenensis (strain ATCC 10597 / BCRC 20456 / CBS 421 / NBRC 0211 / NRRL Y-12639) TaxID=1071378 RepID=G0W9N1_NAUDC|nr:hypothetical protein NDAI_0D01780 [Naumovozyma dairenensis CBS 421]CCD24492.1 hypothetical protein NDAI_0D01780 [Naumovozyma dairenensis CBS 421]
MNKRTMTEYNFSGLPVLPYSVYSKFPPEKYNAYLLYNRKLFEEETARIEFEKAGGIPGLARTKALRELRYFERCTHGSFCPVYISPLKKSNRMGVKHLYHVANDSY